MADLTLNGGQVSITSGQTLSPTGSITANANSARQTSLISGGILNLATAATISVARDGSLASDLTISSQIAGTGGWTKTGNGTLTLAGTAANTNAGLVTVEGGTLALNNTAGAAIAGDLAINGGTVKLLRSNQVADSASVAVASGATFDLNSYAETVGANSGAGTVRTSGGTLTLGAGMSLGGGTLELNGGALRLGGFASTVGTLAVTGSSILDFGTGGASTLSVLGLLSVDPSAILTVQNWSNSIDYFFAQYGDPGADTRSRIVFSGYTGADTKWVSFDHQITPVPEPSVYGAALLGLTALIAAFRVRCRRAA